jgi:hypothetical protein
VGDGAQSAYPDRSPKYADEESRRGYGVITLAFSLCPGGELRESVKGAAGTETTQQERRRLLLKKCRILTLCFTVGQLPKVVALIGLEPIRLLRVSGF